MTFTGDIRGTDLRETRGCLRLTSDEPQSSAKKRWRPNLAPNWTFLVVAAVFGVVFLFITPPFQVPDEPQHFYRAYQVSELWTPFVALEDGSGNPYRHGALLPKSLAHLVDASQLSSTRFRPSAKVDPSRILAELQTPLNRQERGYVPVAPYPAAAYASQALGIALGKFVDASPLALFYLGRFFALVAWIGVVFIAITITPVLKWTYALLALMPMTLHVSASNSVDSMVIALSLLLSAQLLQWAYDPSKRAVSVLDMAMALAVVVVVAATKPPYLLIAGLVLLVPSEKFPNRRVYWLTTVSLLVWPASAYFAWSAWLGSAMSPALLIDFARFGVDHPPYGRALPAEQLRFIALNPVKFGEVLLNTLWQLGGFHFHSFFGILGWVDTRLPAYLSYVYIAATVVSALNGTPSPSVTWKAKSVALGLFGAGWFASLVIFYLRWSTVGMPMIVGFQGRYLIPMAPLFFLLFQRRANTRPLVNNAVGFALAITMVTTNTIAAHTLVSRFYVPEAVAYAIEEVVTSEAGDGVIVKGWVIDRYAEQPVMDVEVELSGRPYPARYGTQRPDVVDKAGKSSYLYSGFEGRIPTSELSVGRHTLALRIRTRDGKLYVVPQPRFQLDITASERIPGRR